MLKGDRPRASRRVLSALATFGIPLLGLVGVLVGGWLTGYHQRQQRRQTVIREQLEHFYSPMVALRKRIRAKSETREKIHSIADEVWREKVERDLGPEQLRAMEAMMEPEFAKL